MSANVNLDTVFRPFVIVANFGINSLTKLYYSSLNPQWDSMRKKSSAVTFHYNVKVTLHNAATAFLTFQVAKTFFGKGSFRSLAIDTCFALFAKTVLEKTLSMKSDAKTLLKGVLSQIAGDESLEGVSLYDNAYSSICVAASKAQSLHRNMSWKQDLLVIQGYSILKNWAPLEKL